jgi:hypothetical protein
VCHNYLLRNARMLFTHRGTAYVHWSSLRMPENQTPSPDRLRHHTREMASPYFCPAHYPANVSFCHVHYHIYRIHCIILLRTHHSRLPICVSFAVLTNDRHRCPRLPRASASPRHARLSTHRYPHTLPSFTTYIPTARRRRPRVIAAVACSPTAGA